MINLLLGQIWYPGASEGNWIAQLTYKMLQWIMSWGWVSYGFAIIIFTVFLKLIVSPLDFTNRYFTKKNQIMMQKIAPEEKLLKETYAGDPMAMQRARQELYRKHGAGQGGFCLVMLINLVVTMVVFLSVFSGLRRVANQNIVMQAQELNQTYTETIAANPNATAAEISEVLNAKYEEMKVSFLWVKNMWRADTWASEIMPYKDYSNIVGSVKSATDIGEDRYKIIFGFIEQEHNGWGGLHWNGWLLLIAMAGGVTYISTWLSMLVNKKNTPQKTGTKTEPIISYSLRDARNQSSSGQPEIDPAQVNKIMQVIMPIVMVTFAFSSTSAMSVYIIASSAVSTVLTLALSFIVDIIIKRQKPKNADGNNFDPEIINPHAKYFKNKGSK
jgi:YidC/Oxa1 family membrane protein insertase